MYDFLVTTNRPTSGVGYQRATEALRRLAGTRIETNIETDGYREREGFGLVDSWRVVEKSRNDDRMVAVEVDLPRWLRPDYQAPDATQVDAELATEQVEAPKTVAATKGKATFPKSMPEQIRVLREALAERPHTTESMAELFKRKPRKSVEEGLASLVAAGIAQYEEEVRRWLTCV